MAVGKKITDLTASGSLKDTDLAIVHDGNGTKRSTLTQLGEYMGTKFSNPNLLINPDFKINQRGLTSYNISGFSYTVDRWRSSSKTVTVSDSGLTIQTDDDCWFSQKFEKAIKGKVTLSIKISAINGKISLSPPANNLFITSPGVYSITLDNIEEYNLYITANTSVTIEWAKLEQGSIATPFVAPNPADELAKCRRFYELINMDTRHATLIGDKVYVTVDVVPKRITPTCKHSGNVKAIISNSMELPLTFNSATAIGGSVLQSFDVSSSTQGDGFCKDFKCTMDAEIY